MKITTHQKKTHLSYEENDQLIVTIDYNDDKKKIENFCIIQLTGTPPKQVIKYDTAHGFCHVHKYYCEQKETERIDLGITPETIRKLVDDIEKNWEKYKIKLKQKINNMNVI